MAAGARRRRWLNLILVVALIVTILPGGAYAEPPAPSATPGALDDEPFGTALDATGGTIELMGQGQLFVPSGALPGRSRLYFHTVEMSASSGLARYHPIDQAIHIEARRADDGSRINRLGRPATVRLQLNRPEVPQERVGQPEVRLLDAGGWVEIPSTYDPASMTITCDITALPATIAVVDGSLEPSAGDWDPKDPAAVQLSDGSWGVAYVDSVPNLLYRRTLDGSQPYFWRDRKTVDTNADSPALVKVGSTLALFYRKASGSYKQVHLRTSTDGGDNWSGPTVLTSEGVDVYQIQAVNDGGTVYVFWSLSNTSGLLQY